MSTLPVTIGSVIEHADALDWLEAREPGTAAAVVFDPPYAVGSPVRGREDGAAGSVSGPLSFMQRTMSLGCGFFRVSCCALRAVVRVCCGAGEGW